MPAAARLNDTIAPHGCWSDGVITGGSGKVTINGQPAAFDGSPGTPHYWVCPFPPPDHPVKVIGMSSKVTIEGKAAARVGDPTDCGSVIASGSANVTIG